MGPSARVLEPTGSHVTEAGRGCATPLEKFSPAHASPLDHGATASGTLLVQHHDGERERFSCRKGRLPECREPVQGKFHIVP